MCEHRCVESCIGDEPGIVVCVECGEMFDIKPGQLIIVDNPLTFAREVKMKRISRTKYFMTIAQTVAKRGTCPRASVGAVVVNSKNRILGTGYNGSPPFHPHCLDEGCKIVTVNDEEGKSKEYCIRTIHAEVNAVLTVQNQDDSLIMYSTHHPCFECIKVIAARGISRVFYLHDYTDPKWERIKGEYRDRLEIIKVDI